MKGILGRIERRLRRLLIAQKKFCAEESLLLVGSPRSGTSWLTEMLANLPGFVVNWEPFHPIYGALPIKLGWGGHVTLAPAEEGVEERVRETLQMRSASSFTLRMATPGKCISADRVLVKSVRVANSLPWIVGTFDFDLRPIYLLRHPVSTALSHLRAFSPRGKTGEPFVVPGFRNNAHYLAEEAYLASLPTDLEVEIAIWCLDNRNTIAKANSRDYITVFYEDLVLNPRTELERMLYEVGLEVSPKFYDSVAFRKASDTDLRKDLVHDAEVQIRKYLSKVTSEQLDACQQVLEHFGVQVYRANNPFPVRKIA